LAINEFQQVRRARQACNLAVHAEKMCRTASADRACQLRCCRVIDISYMHFTAVAQKLSQQLLRYVQWRTQSDGRSPFRHAEKNYIFLCPQKWWYV